MFCRYNRLLLTLLLFTSFALSAAEKPSMAQIDAYFAAVKTGKTENVAKLLAAGIPIDVRNERLDGKTALMIAAKRLKPEMVEFLAKKGAIVNAVDKKGNTALLEACRTPNREYSLATLRALLKCGASLTPPEPKDGKKQRWKSPLITAIENGNLECASFLQAKGSAVNVASGKKTPLNVAIENFHNDLAKEIVGKGAHLSSDNKWIAPPLEVAIKSFNHDMVEFLVQNGAPIKASPDRLSLVTVAASEGNAKGLATILKAGADINTLNSDGMTPLQMLVRFGELDAAKLLLKNGADVNRKNDEGQTALMLANESKVELEVCTLPLDMPDQEVAGDDDAEYLRHMLAALRSVEDPILIKTLLKSGAKVDTQDNRGMTALMYQAKWRQMKACKVLIEAGANVALKDKTGNTALHYAARMHDKELYNFLVKAGASAEAVGEEGKTPRVLLSSLPEQIREDGTAMPDHILPGVLAVRPNVDGGATPTEREKLRLKKQRDANEKLIEGCKSGDKLKVTEALDAGADIDQKDGSGMWRTPLIIACERGDQAVAKVLVEKGANLEKPGAQGATPLYCAIEAENLQLVKYLLDSGASVSASVVDNSPDRGYKLTPLRYALNNYLYEIADVLLKHGADINQEFDTDSSLLETAALSADVELVDYMLKNGADLEAESDFTQAVVHLLRKDGKANLKARGDGGMTLLHWATMLGDRELAGQLIKSGIDINTQTPTGETALFMACVDLIETDDLDMVQFLLKQGADVTRKNVKGDTVTQTLELAIEEMKSQAGMSIMGDSEEVKAAMENTHRTIRKAISLLQEQEHR